MTADQLTTQLTTAETKAHNLYAILREVKVCRVPTMSRDRCIPRKEQAALARKLFKQLGLKGISVTTPNYSMAQAVKVRLPSIPDSQHASDKWPHYHDSICCGVGSGHTEANRCPQCRDHAAAELAVGEILARAFPQHDDRNDLTTDYFNYCWSID